ncbi:Rrf2 family transcriptional regulator [Lactiplantibacillus mudanjiangensis]|uniref:Rrf2 family transcriptional regulator [Lactobacillus paraplantarum] n=1 Tax=Lactiplantibacillus mudanjiangensis TaxID=1296538 RepID=A0A660E7Y8_9LACO|nr:Rrf2 family transcriptional regulator [Lactiplantibacillus mudanjiangensis]VDG21124.1 Rrf2 family transcriptional regulator [Lactobacillus paraplantarum] [Lactiplantibacillus mudanjiangensis]VDG22940.1 Rrf2 family transcriptional regulator [Lactobacillus paraplantarum] [Lactiplantibacillus mudanjiangensis]VDG29201.1 Rrf2 family transcriptional regulator [Lactobacillus paraplantarum] [Lactiplantibacillus mudanjiangensis]VDG31724.1 Rrf2 family transcriptional regulator [Lactobacillus paraplant
MRVSTRFSDAIHLLAFLKIYDQQHLTSDLIASSIETSPVVVRRLMGKLRQAGLIKTVPGSAQPTLAKPLDQISLLAIFYAVEGDKPLFSVDPKTNPDCIVGGNIQTVLRQYYQDAQTAAEARLAKTSLQDIVDNLLVEQAKKEALS